MSRSYFLLVFFACLSVHPSTVRASPLAVSFEEESVVVEGLGPGADTVLLGAGRGVAGFLPYRIHVATRLNADAAGTIRLELSQPLPTISVWAVVDLAEGAVMLASPPGQQVREVAFPGRGIPASLNRLEDAKESLVVLWVRPPRETTAASPEPAGAWAGRIVDGSDRDGDERQDRRVSVRLDLLTPLGASPAAPLDVAPGDVLVGIDPQTLEIYTVRLRS